MHNADSIFFPNSRHSTTGDKTFSLRSKMVPSIADNKHLGTSYDDFLKPSLSPFGGVVAFFEASLSISFLGLLSLISKEKSGCGHHVSSRVQHSDHFKLSLKSLISQPPCYQAPFNPRTKSTIFFRLSKFEDLEQN